MTKSEAQSIKVTSLKAVAGKQLGAKTVKEAAAILTGIIYDRVSGQSRHGDYVGYKGSFSLTTVNPETGEPIEIFEATTLYPPGISVDVISKSWAEAQSAGAIQMEIGLLIRRVPDDETAIGYVYTAENLSTEGVEDSRAKMRVMSNNFAKKAAGFFKSA